MRVVYILLFLLVTIAALQACKKKVQTAPVTEEDLGSAGIDLKNTISDSVYLFLNGHDIKTGVIPHVLKMTLAPDSQVSIPRADLRDAHIYEYSWNTADYTYSNWWALGSNNIPVAQVLTYYSKFDSNYSIEISSSKRNDLIVCLDGDGISSTWEPVDAFDKNGTSVWDTISAEGKNHSFIISRYHTIRHRFLGVLGKDTSTNLAFALDISNPRTWLRVGHLEENYILTNNLDGIASLQTSEKDKLYFAAATVDTNGNVFFNGPYYLLTRRSVER